MTDQEYENIKKRADYVSAEATKVQKIFKHLSPAEQKFIVPKLSDVLKDLLSIEAELDAIILNQEFSEINNLKVYPNILRIGGAIG